MNNDGKLPIICGFFDIRQHFNFCRGIVHFPEIVSPASKETYSQASQGTCLPVDRKTTRALACLGARAA